MAFTHDSFVRPYPNSTEEYYRYEESLERRQEAASRYRRQQFELFELESDPGCKNCGEVGGLPVYGVSEDESTGYHSDDEGCTLCMGRAL